MGFIEDDVKKQEVEKEAAELPGEWGKQFWLQRVAPKVCLTRLCHSWFHWRWREKEALGTWGCHQKGTWCCAWSWKEGEWGPPGRRYVSVQLMILVEQYRILLLTLLLH
jgi:hypothetical protein